MKVLFLNGSPHNDPKSGVIAYAFELMARVFKEANIDYEIVNVGLNVKGGCIDCNYCKTHEGCAISDDVDIINKKLAESDALILGSPVYYASVNGSFKAFLDRLFHSGGSLSKRLKLGAAVVSCRRGGASATFDELNKYFTISEMTVISSRYWNSIHGNTAEEAAKDEEGKAVMIELAHNFVYMLRCLELGRDKLDPPPSAERKRTNFI